MTTTTPPLPPLPASGTTTNTAAPRTARVPTVDARFFEGRLARALRGLDPTRAIDHLVLCDAAGLPMAVADAATNADPEPLGAIAAQALDYLGRLAQTIGAADVVTARLADGRLVQVRPVPGTHVGLCLVSLGRELPSDERFVVFAREVLALVGPA